MVVLSIETSGCQPQTIVIGRRGTYETTQIAFDLSYLVEAYGSGVAVLAVKRSQDESAYPAVVTQENNTLTWTVSETDTAYVGAGECQLMWYVDGGLAKTIIYPMVVMRDILSTAEEPPDGYENWIEHLTGLGAETQQNAQNAAQSASEAKESEESAAESAQRAEDAAGMLVDVSATATTLEPGQPATAEYDEGVFKFGIPKGDKLTYTDLTEADKEDLVQGPIKAAQDAAVDAVGTAKTNAVDAVNGAGTTQVQNVNSAGATNVNAVNQAGETQVNTVNQAGATQVGNVNQAGATQVQAIEDKGDEVIDSIPSDYSDLTAEVDNLNRQLSDETTGLDTKAPVILETASGAIASFSDGADSMPIKKLVANIEPVQDLHRYDNPWPGGGMGNLAYDVLYQGQVSITWGGVTLSIKDGKWRLVGTALYNGGRTDLRSDPFLLKAGTYNISNDVQIADIILQKASDNSAIVIANIDSRTFTLEEDTNVFIGVNMVQGTTYNADIALLLNAGSTKGTWYPYSNICPISGHTGAEIEQAGVNVFDKNNANILEAYTNTKIVKSPDHRTIFIPCKPNTKYIASNSATNRVVFGYTTAVPGIDVDVYSMDNGQTGADAKYLVLYCWNRLVDTATLQDTLNAVQIELGSTVTAYAPYTGNQISVTFPTTIYGGEDEVITGKLKSTMGMVDLGTMKWILNTSTNRFQASITDAKKPSNNYTKANMVCSVYSTVTSSQTESQDYDQHIGLSQYGVLVVRDTRYADAAAFKTAMSGVQLCYELAEPVEYTLTGNEMTTLYGTNNIWSSTGDTEVTYPCDTRLYIDNKITQAIANALNS